MKRVWKCLAAAALILMLTATAALAETVLGMCTGDNVKVRYQPGTDQSIWFSIDEGFVCEILGEVTEDGDKWYKVQTTHPDDQDDTGVGYIHSRYLRPLANQEDEDDQPTLRPSTDSALGGSVADYTDIIGPEVKDALGRVTSNNVSLRAEPNTECKKLGVMKKGDEVELLSIPPRKGTSYWFRVRVDEEIGYIHSNYIKVLDEGTLVEPTPTVKPVPTYDPGAEEDDPVVPGVEDEYLDIIGPAVKDARGRVTTDNVSLREKPTTESKKLGTMSRSDEVELLSIPPRKGNDYWYRVRVGDELGYIHSNYIKVLDEGTLVDPTPTVKPEPTYDPGEEEDDPAVPDVEDEYLDIIGPAVKDARGRVTADNVSLREKPTTESKKLGTMSRNDEVELLSIPPRKGNDYWYRVRVGDELGYIHSNYIKVLDAGIQIQPTPTASPTATPTVKPGTMPVIGTGIITASGVNFRLTPSAEGEKIGKMNAGTVVELLVIPDYIGEAYWYRVRYNGQEGYIQSNYVRVLSTENTPTLAPNYYGYAMLDCTSANLRDEPGGVTKAQWNGMGTLLPIAGPAEEAEDSRYLWYPVYYGADNKIYYIREDLIKVVNSSGSEVTPPPVQPSKYGYVRVVEAGAHLRLKPFGEKIDELRRGTVLPCISEPEHPEGTEYDWFQVDYNGVTGYVRGDSVVICNADGSDYEVSTPVPTATPVPGSLGYIRMTSNKVYIRETAGGTILGQLMEGQILPIMGSSIDVGKYTWYCVGTPDGIVGYVRSDMFVECDAQGNKVTPAPTPAATPKPDDGPILSSYGYVQITGSSVNVREKAGGKVLTTVKKGTVWPMVGVAKKVDGDTWYPIQANDEVGYVSGTVSFKLSKEQEAAYLAGLGVPVVTPDPSQQDSSFLIVTGSTVYLREKASQDSAWRYEVKRDTVLPFIGSKSVGTKTWYNVVYEGLELWIHGDYIRVMTQAEYNEWLGDYKPEELKQLGWVRYTTNGVYVRNAAGGSVIVDQLNKGTVVAYYKETADANGTLWYQVKTPKGEMGYSSSRYLEKCQEDGSELPLQTPPPGSADGNNTQQETTYSTLKKGDSGQAVRNLVEELKNQGYYTGAVTDQFTTAVETAVKSFQKANGLNVDGVAGSSTQHKLFGTVPIGSGNSDLSFAIYPVEKIDWFTGGIQQMIPRGSNFKIYDIKTGMVWWAHRWAGGYHADIETLTAADTAKLCKMFGVSDASQINDVDHWRRRPSLVTIGTRTFACSLYGVPHNPAGDTIPDNKMTGQICLHFTNSKGHETGVVSTSHTAAIKEAYEWAKKYYGAK